MSNNKCSFKETKYSNLTVRRDYSKIDTSFQEPDLLEVQKKSYERFIETELKQIIKTYFPVRHPKSKYEVAFNDIKILHPNDEEKARKENKTYERPLYVDLFLINNETGEVDKPRTKTGISDGVFFANIPAMTKKGTFIINGIEKFVISQIVRSPGVYALDKSQIKLNTKKKINEGHICEVLPSRGTQMHFIIDQKYDNPLKAIVEVKMRSTSGEAAVSFPATQLLKAFGMTQDEILKIFDNNEYIINTLNHEKYNHQSIMDDDYILSIRKTANDVTKNKTLDRGSPIDSKLKKAVFEYEAEVVVLDELRDQYDSLFDSISAEYEALHTQKDKLSGKEKAEIEDKIRKLSAPTEKLLEKLKTQELKLRSLVDTIITEKAARDIIANPDKGGIGVKFNEAQLSGQVCYREVLTKHFTDSRQYDLTAAGRYKLQRKLRVSERLYQRVLAEDIENKDGKVLVKKGTLILKEELDKIKNAFNKNELKLSTIVEEGSKNKAQTLETVSVYADKETLEYPIRIIGTHGDINTNTLTLADIIAIVSYTIGFPYGIGQKDDIDHLGNKRLRLIHEQLKTKLQAGMVRVEKYIKEKLAAISIPTANEEQKQKIARRTKVSTVVNTKAFQLAIKNFFNTYQLTQFLDQQNPLSELTNKRRISAMGDGGITREDPNLDIRDVHYSHYGRICPIETPEGMNIGLIMSLAAFTKVDPETGFLLTPYKKVIKGVIQDEIEWMTSLREDEYIICESTSKRDASNPNKLVGDNGMVVCRYRSTQEIFPATKVDYIEISPRQVVSIATGAIPFLENDDTTRALMGANMQRQAVPLLSPRAPIVATGSEYKIAHDSGIAITSEHDGVVEYVDGNKIVVEDKDGKKHTHKLIKFRMSNQSTCINQVPIVEEGQKIKSEDTLVDGPAMQNGELALGRNPLVAFTTWNGYNFEDAIVVSDRLVQQDIYTSISIEEYTLECLRKNLSKERDGDEEVTRDVPNVSEEAKRFLDEDGVIMVGAEVKEGDILVGKVTPKGQNESISSIEKLLQAISGGKIKNIRDTSLKVPHGGEGIVAKVERFHSRDGYELEDDVIERIKVYIVQKRKIQIGDKMAGRHGNKGIVSIIVPVEDMPHLEDGTPIDICLNPLGVPSRMNLGQIMEIHLGLALREIAKNKLVEFVIEKTPIAQVVSQFGLVKTKAETLIKVAKKYFKDANVETIEQANKKIKDVDLQVILNSAGLDVEDLSIKAATPVFMGANLSDITSALKEANIDPEKTHGKYRLIDGRSGDYFDGEITVGVMYMMKLDHMVDDKIHARSVGPYSQITQQPLGGKSQNGGQRFGEMEVWALEAYGAAYNLRELLTIKSDDVKGRYAAYSAIVKGKQFPTPSIPESFKLLTKQLQGLGLSITVKKEDGTEEDMNDYTTTTSEDDFKTVDSENAEEMVNVNQESNEALAEEQY